MSENRCIHHNRIHSILNTNVRTIDRPLLCAFLNCSSYQICNRFYSIIFLRVLVCLFLKFLHIWSCLLSHPSNWPSLKCIAMPLTIDRHSKRLDHPLSICCSNNDKMKAKTTNLIFIENEF